MICRHCVEPLQQTFLDLGFAPPSNAYLAARDLHRPERYFPLRLKVCTNCWLVQTDTDPSASELFSADYAYFSSTSLTWLDHAARYTGMIVQRLQLNGASFVIEVASNDGYLLKNFLAAQIPCLGIEPTDSTATAAESLGIPVLREFFSEALGKRIADQGKPADLIIGNNVFAHVPEINDFARGLKAVLKPGGTITLEFPHLMRLIENTEFDTVYHEHFSYFSLHTVSRILGAAGLRLWDVEELPTHGGSLRVYCCHQESDRSATGNIERILAAERRAGLLDLAIYDAFQNRVNRVKDALLIFLIEEKRAGRRLAAYGAAAKGNTLLNYAGVKPDLVPFVCDAAASKQGKFLPGSHIPILSPSALRERKPDRVLILPWNIADEICRQHAYIEEWGGRFVVAVPEIRIL
jgi:C-methyltransferase C-terminal domain/Putative zinc binding domain/Methyltransferase domain